MKFRFSKDKKNLQIKLEGFSVEASLLDKREYGSEISKSTKVENFVLVEIESEKFKDLKYKTRDHFLWGYQAIDGNIFRHESINYKVWRPKTSRYTKTNLSTEELLSIAVVSSLRDVKFLLKTNSLDKVIEKFKIDDWLERQ